MRSTAIGLIMALVGAVSMGCSSTTFTSTWSPPGVTSLDFSGKKIAALFLSREISDRHTAEDVLVREITARGGIGVPSYAIIADKQFIDLGKARTTLRTAGMDSVIIMRIIGKNRRITQVPGSWRRAPFGITLGDYSSGVHAGYDPGYLREDNIVRVETLIYDLALDKLLWAGVSSTFNPTKTEPFVKELAAAVAKEMQKQGY